MTCNFCGESRYIIGNKCHACGQDPRQTYPQEVTI